METFSAKQLPTPRTILDTTASLVNPPLIKVALQKYKNGIQKVRAHYHSGYITWSGFSIMWLPQDRSVDSVSVVTWFVNSMKERTVLAGHWPCLCQKYIYWQTAYLWSTLWIATLCVLFWVEGAGVWTCPALWVRWSRLIYSLSGNIP